MLKVPLGWCVELEYKKWCCAIPNPSWMIEALAVGNTKKAIADYQNFPQCLFPA